MSLILALYSKPSHNSNCSFFIKVNIWTFRKYFMIPKVYQLQSDWICIFFVFNIRILYKFFSVRIGFGPNYEIKTRKRLSFVQCSILQIILLHEFTNFFKIKLLLIVFFEFKLSSVREPNIKLSLEEYINLFIYLL